MEHPTHVLDLIHAYIMVNADIFLTARSSPVYKYASNVLNIIAIIGASTVFFAVTVRLLQNYYKFVITYSTCSQLGPMIFLVVFLTIR